MIKWVNRLKMLKTVPGTLHKCSRHVCSIILDLNKAFLVLVKIQLRLEAVNL